MGEVLLRPARASDVARLIRVCLDARASADIPNLHTDAEDLAFFSRLFASKPTIVAETAGVPVGFAVVHDGWLEHLWVDPGHHRRGIGRTLLAWARAEAAGDLRLYVFTHNVRAIAFYRAHGAVQIADSDGQGNEEKLPDLTLLIPQA
ncbi:MAG: GNAT family N-acetyltransferase [Rhodospirillaceae bacterium]|nr:GNAT family N-acetyltransferase [Rhodospirillaceae bacterium]